MKSNTPQRERKNNQDDRDRVREVRRSSEHGGFHSTRYIVVSHFCQVEFQTQLRFD